MQIKQKAGGWFVNPETAEERRTSEIDSLSGPWDTEEAAILASKGRFYEAHAAEKKNREARA